MVSACATAHPIDKPLWWPSVLLTRILFLWASPASFPSLATHPDQQDVSALFLPLPANETALKTTQDLLACNPQSDTPDASTPPVFHYQKAVISYGWRKFALATFLLSFDTLMTIAQIQFMLQIVQFLQDEALGVSSGPRDAYLYALGLSLATYVYEHLHAL